MSYTDQLPLSDDSEQFARQKFGTQKGISSDEFFGRASYDPSAQAEAKTRLQGFEGAQAISSNAYFGRPEEEAQEGDYGDLETAAKDLVRKFGITAGDDLENLTNLLGEGAGKLQGKSFGCVICFPWLINSNRCDPQLPQWLRFHATRCARRVPCVEKQ